MSIEIDVRTAKTGFWHLPKTFYAVLFIEFWERFAFYGLQSIAVIYFIQKFGIKEADADNLFASFSALLYALLTVGGAIGDKYLGLRRTYFLGIAFLIIGYGALSMSSNIFWMHMSMGIVLVGNALFKTNANNYVGRCFESNDPRLDAAFTYFYMAINLGSFSSMVIIPILASAVGYHEALSLCAVGMVVGLLSFFWFFRRFRDSDNAVGKNTKRLWMRMLLVSLVAVVLAICLGYLLQNLILSRRVLYFIAVVTIIIYLIIATRVNRNEAKGMYIALLLLLIGIVFFAMYIQTATSMTLFALQNVRLTVLGYTIPAGVTQSFNGMFIVLFSPILANLYTNLHVRNINFTIPAKFVLGILLTGCCFVCLGLGGRFFADANAQISLWWMVIAYAFYSAGELFVSALGASMMAQLLPKRFGGFAQGVWYLFTAIGMKIGGELSGIAAEASGMSVDKFGALNAYVDVFYKLGLTTIAIAFVLSFTVRRLSRAMQSVLDKKY
ncbi:MAG: proton-dependent oligopeptide transporter, family [Pseudomonadota bacterium]|nr:proton-dependent oligopeptide transporter, family [Pseudomonadota bacterium]